MYVCTCSCVVLLSHASFLTRRGSKRARQDQDQPARSIVAKSDRVTLASLVDGSITGGGHAGDKQDKKKANEVLTLPSRSHRRALRTPYPGCLALAA